MAVVVFTERLELVPLPPGLPEAIARVRRRPRDVPVAALKMTLFERVHMPSFAGATEWLNSEPLGTAELRGHVVLVNFWTWTCINWLRQQPLRASRPEGNHPETLRVMTVVTRNAAPCGQKPARAGRGSGAASVGAPRRLDGFRRR
jgi:hypothetical protein